MQYSSEKNLPSSHMPKVVSDVAGGFEFFIEDIEKVGNDISAIIDNSSSPLPPKNPPKTPYFPHKSDQ
jgi:hypothetical protein